ncbi:unnamed protein product [Calicophoron daubneyi]|uniref:HD domain-containing protein n=1 Tax=Calicophoron daubneyi TaxID=300641 RepID=A0AAV2TTZ8_CALDB
MNQLCDLVPKESADEIQALWNEYEAQETMEARLCKDFDKFEMLLQAFEYEKENNQPKQLEDFFSNTLDCFVTPTVKNWVHELCEQRKQFENASVFTEGDRQP